MFKSKSSIIGVDVGGTKILLQSFDKKMHLIGEEQIETQSKKGQKAFVKQLIDLIERHFHRGIKGVGVALPGIVDQSKGVLVKAPHLPVKNLKLKGILETHFETRVILDNDINAFLWSQSKRPGLSKYTHLVALMIGTGVGGAMMIEGKLIYGKNGFAGEAGHMIIRMDSPLKTLEQNTSGSYISNIAKELGVRKGFTAQHLSEKTPETKKVLEHIVGSLGIGLASLNLIFNPNAFVLGGSIYNNYLRQHKRELMKIIAKQAMDSRSPQLIDADKEYDVARGIAMMMKN